MNAIEVRGVSKVYRRYGRRRQFGTLKSAFLAGRGLRELGPDQTLDALKQVSFDVVAGRTFGIVGRNGSGKSTLLKLIAGIGRPTQGDITVRGRVSALIELGAGFHPEISGRENVFINGMMLGLARREIAAKFDDIVEFAELQDFIDAPVKTYSSGMYMRLGFSVAIHVDPDVLLVDEVLAVGDEAFTHRCLDRLADLRRQGRTVLLVTHSLDLVRRFCDEALWLDAGTVRYQGDPRRVIDAYLLDVARAEDAALRRPAGDAETGREGPERHQIEPAPQGSDALSDDMSKAAEGRWGSREVEIVDVDLVDAEGRSTRVFPSGAPLEIRLAVRANRAVADLVFGIGLFNAEGVCCYGTNTRIEGATGGSMTGSGEVRVAIDRLDLVEGTYKLDVAAHRENGAPYDYHRLLHVIRVHSPLKEAGIFRPPHRWTFSGGIRVEGLEPPE